ncbi:sulfatase-like hydrolase/transferase [Flavobacteriaceae bacterium]|nr:sulfatase-like hydrolase/transferase [Flavobacteriaceae bacterium]
MSQFVVAQEKQPNILFLFVDDLAYDCVASHGNKQVKTPNIDRLTKQSTHFTHAYNAGSWSGAVCLASRTQMMSGQKIWHAAALSMGIKNNTNPAVLAAAPNAKKVKLQQLAEAKLFWPQILEKEGYETYYAGKWHVGGESMAKATWNHTKNIRSGMPKQLKSRYNRTFVKGEKSSWSPTDKANGGYWQGGQHWSEVLRDDAFEFLDSSKKSDKPFLMTIAFNAPHDPKQAPQEFQDMYPYDNIEVPENFLPEYPHDNGAIKIRDERLAPFPRTPYSIQVNRSEYYALITHLDLQIGKVLNRLEETGQADNTYIFFTADHGLAVGHHGLTGKQNMYDHSVRVPWLISGPGIPKGKKVDTPIYLQDVMATSIDVAGIKKPTHVEFNSVLPLIKGDTKNANKAVYSSYYNHQRMVRTDEFKYIIYPLIGVELLYNIKKDPLEIKDLASDKSCSKDLKIMRSLLASKMKEFSDPLDLKNPIESYAAYKKKGKSKGHH